MNFLKFYFLSGVLTLLLSTPIYGFCQLNKTNDFINSNYDNPSDSLGKVFYAKWEKFKIKSNLDTANMFFVKSFNDLPLELKHNYAIEIARLYLKNNEEKGLVKDWYLNSIYTIKVKSAEDVEELLYKYTIISEFVKAYGRIYKECEVAMEVLQDYKSELYFEYIKINPSEKKYPALMTELEVEERYLIFDCNKKK